TAASIRSYFSRATYPVKKCYLFPFTFRADGSSRFAPSHRWGYFPAGAIAWRVSQESFLEDVSWLSNLKIRASLGEVGNDNINAGLWEQNRKSDGLTPYSINEVQQYAYSPASSTMANPNLQWETTITRTSG